MTRSLVSIVILACITFFGSKRAEAYPTMVKHGYTTCMTCHFSPSGAGALTNYGKYIAGELFGRYNDSSTALKWLRNPTFEDRFEKKFFADNIDWIVGHQARMVQSYFDTPTLKRGNPRLMQFDFELGASLNEYYAVIQVGARGAQIAPGQKASDLNVRSWYAGARDITYAYRVGKFFPEFGIRYPNHNIPTRKGLFFNHNEEPNLVQFSRYLELIDWNIGYLEGNLGTRLQDKKGYVGTITYRPGQSRTGVSILDASGKGSGYNAVSLFTHVGYHEKGYTLAEYAVLTSKTTGAANSETQLVFIESGWEFTKGVIPYIGFQRNKAVATKITSDSIPVGLKLYPYTHFELHLEASKLMFDEAGTKSEGTAALAMLHWYF